MSGEAPAYLTVGTAVSAKYRGAFCEARVKIINKRLVKCRVNFKDNTNAIVPDEYIKGALKIGSPVEAKHPASGNWQEGVITKLNDASLYTVLFDDGDEKTLGRSSLCLQGEKHFHESETLDHLPLTDPENFGTPVVRDRTKRKRIHPSRTEDDSGESSESEVFKRLRREEPDNAVGKVVIVETNEKRKNLWFPALIVDPSCTKDAPNRTKDHIVTRSFKDNKYYTVSESSWRSFSSKDHLYKGDVSSLKSAVEKAVLYIETGQLPSTWDFNLLRSRDKLEVESEETESSEESSDDEYDEEKDAWLASLHKFMEERGTPINKPPVLGYRDLNLYKLYKLVQDLGGCRKVTDKQQWRYIASKMGIPIHNTSQSYNIKAAYNKYLFAFEDHNRKLGPGIGSVFTRTRRRSSYDRWPHVSPSFQEKKETIEKDKEKKKEDEEKPELEEEELKTPPKKKTRRKTDVTEQEKEEEDDSEKKETPSEEKEKKETTRGAGKRTAAKSAPKEGTDAERDDDDFGPDFEIGEKVKVQYGRGRTHKVYEAKIVDVQGTDKNAKYSVHYLGWNVRYDEVVTADRIVTSLDKRKEKKLARIRAVREKEKEQKQREKELEKEKKEKEKKEKERKEKEAEKVRKEKEKREKEEKERKEKEEREREKKEKKEREEQEKKLKKEQEEREKKEKKERDEKERKEKKERERKKEKEEQERREKEQQERLAAEQLALEEKQKKEKEEKAKLEEKMEKDKQEEDKAKVKGTSKRGRPPSLSPKTSGRPSSPRVSGGSKRSPATSLYPTRSLRSDRNSLSESPFANGLEALKPRSRRGSSVGKGKAERDSGEESEDEPEAEELTPPGEAPSPEKLETREVISEEKDEEVKDEAKPLEPVPEEILPLCEQKPLEEKLDLEMPVFDTKDGKDDEGVQPPKSPPKLKKEGDPEEGMDEVRPEEKVKDEVEESEGKKSKRRSKKGEGKHEKESKVEKKTSKRRHSKDVKPEAVEGETANEQVEESKDAEVKGKEGVEHGDTKEVPKEEASSEEKPEGEEKKKKGRKRGRKSLEEKGKVKGEKKAKKGDGDAESGKRGRRQKRKHEEENKEEAAGAAKSSEEQQTPGKSKEDKPKADEKEESREVEPTSSDNHRMLTASITTPPTTPESSGTGASSPNEDEGHEEGVREGKSETVQARLMNKSDSDSVIDMASSGSSISIKNEQLDEVSSNNSAEKTTNDDALVHPKRGRPNKNSAKKRRKHSESVSEHSSKGVKKSKRKKESRRRTTSMSSSVKQGPSSSDTDDSSNAENKLAKANVKRENENRSEKSHHHHNRTPKPCKYNFTIDVSHISSPDERISMIQNQLIELRKIYLQLKSEVSAIDRRRKRFRRKEREAQAEALAAATSLADISNSAPASSAS